MIGKLAFKYDGTKRKCRDKETDNSAEKEDDKVVNVEIVKQKHNYAILETIVENFCVRMYIMRPKEQWEEKTGLSDKKLEIPKECKLLFSQSFSSEEIYVFVTEVGDENEIHKTERPVVPGFLMAELLWGYHVVPEFLEGKEPDGEKRNWNMNMTFRAPAYADEKIDVYQESVSGKVFAVTEREQQIKLLWEMKVTE